MKNLILIFTLLIVSGCVLTPTNQIPIDIEGSIEPRLYRGSRSSVRVWLHPQYALEDAYFIAQGHCARWDLWANPYNSNWAINSPDPRFLNYHCVRNRPILAYPHIRRPGVRRPIQRRGTFSPRNQRPRINNRNRIRTPRVTPRTQPRAIPKRRSTFGTSNTRRPTFGTTSPTIANRRPVRPPSITTRPSVNRPGRPTLTTRPKYSQRHPTLRPNIRREANRDYRPKRRSVLKTPTRTKKGYSQTQRTNKLTKRLSKRPLIKTRGKLKTKTKNRRSTNKKSPRNTSLSLR